MKLMRYLVFTLVGFSFMYGLGGCSKPSVKQIVLEGNDQVETFTKAAIESLFEGDFDEQSFPILQFEGQAIPYQFLPSQQNWTEVAYFIPAGSHPYRLMSVSGDNLPEVQKAVQLQLGILPDYKEDYTVSRLSSNDSPNSAKHFQMEGPAWENDLVAFRNYYDARNGIDIFGKRTNDLVLDSVGTSYWHSYHEMNDWGMDILKVGNSLGAGAIALQVKDQLYRIGSNSKGSIKKLIEGPLLLQFALTFEGMEIEGVRFDIEHRISIQKGNRYYASEVLVDTDKSIDYQLVTGLVNLHNDTLYNWSTDKKAILATFDQQGYLGEYLGMGITAEPASIDKTAWAPETGAGITQTHLVYFQQNLSPVKFQVYSCWEHENADFKNIEKVKAAMQ